MPENTNNPESDDSDDLDNFDWLDAADDDETTSVEPALTPEDEFALDWMADPEEETEIFDPEAADFDQNFDWTAGLDNNDDDDDEFDLMAAFSGDDTEQDEDSFEAPDDGLGWLAELDDNELDLSAETVGDMEFDDDDEALNTFEEPDETPDWLTEAGVEIEESGDLIGAELAEMESEFKAEAIDFDDDDDEFDVNEIAAGFDLPDELEMEETNWLEEIDTDEPEGRAEIEEEFMLDDSLIDETPVTTIPQIDEDDAESMFPDFVDDIEEVAEEEGGMEWIETLEENAIEVEARAEPDEEEEDFMPAEGLIESEAMSENEIEEFDFAGAAAEADAPGWLANLEDEAFEEDFEEEPDDAYMFASETSGDAEDELDEFEFADERASGADETPDWLADVEDEEAFEADFEAEVDEAFDYSSAIIDEDEPDEALAFLGDTVADVKDDASGYVTDADVDDVEEAFDFAGTAAEMETPEWLADVDNEEDDFEEEVEEAYESATATVDEWSEDLEEATDDVFEFAAETDEAFEDEIEEFDFAGSSGADMEETPDWLADLETTDEEVMPAAPETPDWLSDIETDAPAAVYEIEPDEDTPEWLAELNRQEDEAQADYAEMEEEFIGEEIDPVPADNAPDWLNAMVPGLDVDYEAPEDQPIEDDYVRAEAEESGKDPFDWLAEMVDEELSYPPESVPGAGAAPRAARFVFSKPPLWMRTGELQPQMETAVLVDDDLETDNLDFDEIGEDLPPWLSFDDDDDIFEN